MRIHSCLFALACFVASLFVTGAFAQIPPGAVASNVRVVGYSDVDGRPPFKLSIQQRNGRWYLYAGHLWHRGWTILDVTDPASPRVANFVPGPSNTWTIQMEIGEDKMITALEQNGQGWGGDADRKSTRLNSSHVEISYAVFCLKKKNTDLHSQRVYPQEMRRSAATYVRQRGAS